MKKIFFLAIMMIATISAKAQFPKGTFSIQPKIGATFSWLTHMQEFPLDDFGSDDGLDQTVRIGGIIGVDCDYMVNDNFAIEAELNYSMQGCQWENYTLRTNYSDIHLNDTRLELEYINMPVMAKVYVCKGLAFKAGMQLGLLTSAKMKADIYNKTDGMKTHVEISENIKSECNKCDFSIPVGISYEFKVPIVIDARYNFGLTSVNKEKDYGEKDSKNSVLLLTVGYKFKL